MYIDQDLPENTFSFHLRGLAGQQGEDVLLSRVRSISTENGDRALCRKLAVHFECWPLVLQQLGTFMIRSHTTPREMWDLVQNSARSNVDERIYAYNGNTDYPEGTLVDAWNHILSTLPRDSKSLLNLLSLLDPEGIPAELFPRTHDCQPASFQFLGHGLGYRNARADLMKYGLITLQHDNVISIHRFIQSTRLKMISTSDRNEAFDVALSTLRHCFPHQTLGNHMYNVWDECAKYFTHVLVFSRAEREWTPKLSNHTVYINMMCDCTW